MILIIGLGNPGRKFKRTRHNLGFRVIEKFAKENDFPNFKFVKRFTASISKGEIDHKRIILANPQTFMNESGKAAKKLISNFKLQIANLWIVHDDLDLPLGKIRISKGRGSAGHKGVQSIIDELKIKNFIRFRIGIKNKELSVRDIEKFVLEKFTKEEEKIIKKVIKRTCLAIKVAIIKGTEKAMSEFNK